MSQSQRAGNSEGEEAERGFHDGHGLDFEEFEHFEDAVFLDTDFEGVALATLDVGPFVVRRHPHGQKGISTAIAHLNAEDPPIGLPPAAIEAVIHEAFDLVDVSAQRGGVFEKFGGHQLRNARHRITRAVQEHVSAPTEHGEDHDKTKEMLEGNAGLSAACHAERFRGCA